MLKRPLEDTPYTNMQFTIICSLGLNQQASGHHLIRLAAKPLNELFIDYNVNDMLRSCLISSLGL